MRKIKLNQVYNTKFGKEFTPVQKLPAEPYKSDYYGNITNKEARFKDINGNIIKKSQLINPNN